ncbi:MAG TPA: transglycosylase domain-containing protein [Mycobacteriales bacterium]|nr:transglycosylase domain-containing protein [Mycobacteriales bacterium]
MAAGDRNRLPAASRPLIRRSAAAAIAARRRRAAHVRRRRRQVLGWLTLAVAVGLSSFAAGLLAAPLNYDFQPVPPKSVLLVDASGHAFATIHAPQIEHPVPASDIPLVMRQAMVAAEDKSFYSNSGIDPLAILRAAWRDITGAELQGGSTITQQYVKNVYTGREQTPLRKLREAALAIRLEHHLSKSQILTRYLNTLYLGNGTAGVDSASRFYFGVPIDRIDYNKKTGQDDPTLGLARAATLAGIAPAPSVWNPLNDPKQTRVRELYVLNQMLIAGYITSQQAGDAYGDSLPPIVAKSEPAAQTIAPEFRDLVAQDLQHYGDSTLFESGGMRVKTTLDLNLQQAAVKALHEVLPESKGLDAAVVAVDPRNGDLRAITEKKVGGYVENGEDLADPPPGSINRSSGSTIKPFTLAVALEHGHTLGETHYAPECVQVAVGYRPCNAEGGAGTYSLESALVRSINTVFAPLGVEVGLKRIVHFAERAGLEVGHIDSGRTCGLRKGRICPSYALGIPISPLSLSSAYGSFVNHGVHHPVRTVLSVRTAAQGQLFRAAAKPQGQRVMPAAIADEVTGAMGQVVQYGTGRAARQPFPVYGKTGTTDDFTNAWFSGCTKAVCITVWMGYDQPYRRVHGQVVAHELRDAYGSPVYGGTLPAQMFARIFSNYRELQGSPALIGASPYPSPPAVTATPVAPSTPDAQPTHRRTRKSAPPTKAAPAGATSGKPTPTVTSTGQPLLQPRG